MVQKTVAAQRLFCPLLHSEYKHTIPFTIEGYKRYTYNSIISIFAKTIIPISENHDTMFFEKVEIISSGIVLYRCNGKDVTNLKDHEIIALEAEVKPYVFENQSEFVRPYPYHSFSSHYRGEQLLLSY